MKKGKYAKRRGAASRVLVMLLAIVMIVGISVGGTLAWLMDTDDQVVNTFTDSDINIELDETTGTNYEMIPGHSITKDPVVTLKEDSEPCYVFVKVTENLGSWSDNLVDGENPEFTDYLSYTIGSDWTAVEGEDGVYYKKVSAKTTEDAEYQVILNNKITVSGEVTKEMMDEIDGIDVAEGTTEVKPTLTIKAYAVQLFKTNDNGDAEDVSDEFTIAEAWEKAKAMG